MSGPAYHFIAGLPRSGSTLLAALLRQNPRFHASMTSPMCELFSHVLNGVSPEASLWLKADARRRVLKGLFASYYAEHAGKTAIFDTNRIWPARLPALHDLFPDAKVICMVRDVEWVMDSIEKLIGLNPLLPSKIFESPEERSTIHNRLETLAKRNRLVGAAWSALREGYFGAHAEALLLIDYEDLTRDPAKIMPLIYRFLGEEPFIHDFDTIDYDEPEFDDMMMTPGLHRVRRKVSFVPRPTLLPPDLVDQFKVLNFWKDKHPAKASRITAA